MENGNDLKKNITDSAVPLNSMEHFSVLQPIVLGHVPFTTLVLIYIVRWAETLPQINANIHQSLLDM